MTSRYPRTPQGELRDNGTPALSVVIASVNGYRYIAQCLRSLPKQRHRDPAIVMDHAKVFGSERVRLAGAGRPHVTQTEGGPVKRDG